MYLLARGTPTCYTGCRSPHMTGRAPFRATRTPLGLHRTRPPPGFSSDLQNIRPVSPRVSYGLVVRPCSSAWQKLLVLGSLEAPAKTADAPYWRSSRALTAFNTLFPSRSYQADLEPQGSSLFFCPATTIPTANGSNPSILVLFSPDIQGSA